MKWKTIATATLLLMTRTTIHAQLYFNDGGYHVINYTTTEPVWVDLNAPNMRTHVQLVDGGWIHHGQSIVLKNQSQFTMSGGKMDWSVWAERNSVVDITGGYLGGYLNSSSSEPASVSGGSMYAVSMWGQQAHLDFSDGVIRSFISLTDNASATITGGKIGESVSPLAATIQLYKNSEVTISGGEIINGGIWAGDKATDATLVTLIGSNFEINGVAVSAGTKASSISKSGTITGVLANGDAFNNNYIIKGASDIVVIPEPSTAILLFGAGFLLFSAKRRFF